MVGLGAVYSFFAASMPRSGGDYIYISRGLHPALGFAGNFAQFYANGVVIGGSTIYTQSFIINALVSTGLVGRNPALVDLGFALGSPLWTFIIGTMTIVVFALIALVSTKKLIRLVGIFFILSLVGVGVGIAALTTFDPSGFVSLFNGFLEPYTKNPDTYHTVISATRDAGYVVPSQWSWGDTIKTIPMQMSWLAYTYWFTYMGGEFKNASSVKRQYFSIGGATLCLAGLAAILIWLVERAAGHEFIASMFYAYANLPGALPIPVPPYFNLFAGMVTSNAVVAAVTGIALVAGSLLLTAIYFPTLGRVLLAYSFDRLLPSKFADVNRRFGTPHYGIISLAVFGVASLAVFTLVSPAVFAIVTMGTVYGAIVFDFGLVALAAIVFPYLKKGIFDVSPAKRYQVAGIPLMTVAGIIGFVVVLYSAFVYFTDPAFGIAGVPWLQAYLLGMFLVPLLAFYAIRGYRRRQGIDIDLLFRELPPE
jgi:amino acid transporter